MESYRWFRPGKINCQGIRGGKTSVKRVGPYASRVHSDWTLNSLGVLALFVLLEWDHDDHIWFQMELTEKGLLVHLVNAAQIWHTSLLLMLSEISKSHGKS